MFAWKFLLIVGLSNEFFVEILVEKLEGKIKRSVCISKKLKYYPSCQHYAQFLIVNIMLIIMPAYLMQVYNQGQFFDYKLKIKL